MLAIKDLSEGQKNKTYKAYDEMISKEEYFPSMVHLARQTKKPPSFEEMV